MQCFISKLQAYPEGKTNHPPPPFESLARYWGVPPSINFLLFFFFLTSNLLCSLG